jgi:hypothetical protein
MTYGTLNVDSVVSSDGTTAGGLYGFKNRIINGAMMIDQRNAGASKTPTTVGGSGNYTLDRWNMYISAASKVSVQQDTTAPSGYVNSLKITSLAATSVGASDYYFIYQPIECCNAGDLAWGTASAQSVTLSFKVRSSLTGTFGGSIGNYAGNRSYPFTYSIPVADTWTTISVTIPGDTTGTWYTSATAGFAQVMFGLGMGSTYSGAAGAWAAADYRSATGATSVVGTNGATFYITGVQLEKGSTATSFDYRPYGTELALCQRYYEYVSVLFMTTAWTTIANTAAYKVTKRTTPTIGNFPSSGTGGAFGATGANAGSDCIFQSGANSGSAGGYVTLSSEL